MVGGTRLRGVVFDFDGVILESVDIKTRAFADLFADWPEHRAEIVRLHLENAGVSRFEKFERIHRDILGVPLDDGDLERLGEAFSQLVLDEILRCEFVAGAEDLVARLSTEYPLFIASATPEEEIRSIVRDRGLERRFAGVYGSPALKSEILERIAAEHRFRPEELVFVGDALSDYEGARSAGVPFVARIVDGGVVRFPEEGVVLTVSDLAELDRNWRIVERATGWSA